MISFPINVLRDWLHRWAIFMHCLSGVLCQKIIRSSRSLAECNKVTLLVGFGPLWVPYSKLDRSECYTVWEDAGFETHCVTFGHLWRCWCCELSQINTGLFFLELIKVEVMLIRLFTKTTWFLSRERSCLTSLRMSYLQETKCVVPCWRPTFCWPVFPLWPRLHRHIVSQ